MPPTSNPKIRRHQIALHAALRQVRKTKKLAETLLPKRMDHCQSRLLQLKLAKQLHSILSMLPQKNVSDDGALSPV